MASDEHFQPSENLRPHAPTRADDDEAGNPDVTRTIEAPPEPLSSRIYLHVLDAWRRIRSAFNSHEIRRADVPAVVQDLVEQLEARFDDFDGVGKYVLHSCRKQEQMWERDAVERYILHGVITKRSSKESWHCLLEADVTGGQLTAIERARQPYQCEELPLEDLKATGRIAGKIRELLGNEHIVEGRDCAIIVESAIRLRMSPTDTIVQGKATLSPGIMIQNGTTRFSSDTLYFELPESRRPDPPTARLSFRKQATWYVPEHLGTKPGARTDTE